MEFAVALIASFISAWLITKTINLHGRLTLDRETSGIRRFHRWPVPRIGGVGLLIGLAAGGIYHGFQADNELYLVKWAGVAALPVFLGGLAEDVVKHISPRDRLLLAFLSAVIAYYELGCGITRIGWPWFDLNVMSYPGISLVLTVFMVGGVAHATNIIDGFNGLLIGFAILALLSLGWVAHEEGLDLLVIYISIVIGALVGVFLINFPGGKIFLGDGGAYLVGFILALISLLLVKTSRSVSPLFPLIVVVYPVFETLFSMYRKHYLRNIPVSSPDGSHLHMLVYGRIVRYGGKFARKNRNAATSVFMWLFSLTSIVPGLIWWDSTKMLALWIVIWVAGYLWLYRRIVRFKF